MSKIFKYLIITITIIVIIICFMGIKNKLKNNTNFASQENISNEEKNDLSFNEGMRVTLLGGSNMEDKGNINSMGYFILLPNKELIFIDGGRDIDGDLVKFYINKYGNGKVNHWFITHPHSDHAGALLKLLAEENNLEVDNIYYSFLKDEWYKEHDTRGYETAHIMLERLNSTKIKNRIECYEGQVIEFGNIKIDIIRTPNPEIINSDNGNDASMTFKITATDVDKSILFLGDSYVYASKELLDGNTKILKSDSVQMSHHGQNGVSKEVYDAIQPSVCFFNCPRYLYDNDNGTGYNTGKWQTVEVRRWMDELETVNYKAFNGDQTFEFTKDGIIKIEDKK